MRPTTLALLALTLLALAPVSAASPTLLFSKTYDFNGIYPNVQTRDAFTMPTPNGTGVACYHRDLFGGPLGSITIRVLDANGNTAFVDEIAGAGLVGADTPAVGFGVFAPGTWHVQVTANGDILGTSVVIHIYSATSLSQCPPP